METFTERLFVAGISANIVCFITRFLYCCYNGIIACLLKRFILLLSWQDNILLVQSLITILLLLYIFPYESDYPLCN